MAVEQTTILMPDERIKDKIYLIRDQKVMLDRKNILEVHCRMYFQNTVFYNWRMSMMKTTSRRKFIKSASVLGLALPLLNPNEIFGQQIDSFTFHSPFMKVAMRKDFPQLASL
jgi:hypothetical protein